MWLKSFLRRVRGLWRSETIHQEITDELQFHIDMRVEENIRRGMSPDEARRDAERSFGNRARIKEQGYDVRGGRWLETVWQDLRYGARSLVKNPLFTLIAVLTLALGIGANTAIFSIVNAVLLRPLPYREPEKLLTIWTARPQQGQVQFRTSLPNFKDWREQSRVFEGMAAYGFNRYNLTGGGEPEQIRGAQVSDDFFKVMGVQAALGRTFTPKENSGPFVVLSDAFWRHRFSSDPGVIGKTLTLNGTNFTIVGVMPEHFDFPGQEIVMWVTFSAMSGAPNYAFSRTNHSFCVVGRLKDGVTPKQAQTEMDVIASRLRQQYPETNANLGVSVIPLYEQVVGNVRLAMLVLLGAVAIVLLISCANVANLLLARAVAREREFAVRAALGAGRWRLIRQLLTESLLLALLGGSLGVLLAVWGISSLNRLDPGDVPRLDQVSVDGVVLGFTLVVTVLSGIIFGIAPALSAKANLSVALKDSGKGAIGSRRGQRLRSILVVSEIALALILLVSAGLMIRSFLRLLAVDPGFNPHNLLTMQIILPASKYSDAQRLINVYREVFERLTLQPGVEAVGAGTGLPPVINQLRSSFTVEGYQPSRAGVEASANFLSINPKYFKTLGIPLIAGRAFSDQDNERAPRVAIISQRMAKRYFPDRSAIGGRLSFGGGTNPQWCVVVGVVSDVKYSGSLSSEEEDAIYLPYPQAPTNGMYLMIRAGADPLSLVTSARSVVRSIDPDVPIAKIKMMDEVIDSSVARPRLIVALLGLFGAIALALAVIGIYGVISYAVAQCGQEIGIRMALGAKPSDVLKMMVGRGARLALAGVAIGVIGSFAATRALGDLLFGVGPTDPLTFGGVATLLTGVSILASYIPARRAMKVDPVTALK
ncbi:MAG: ABC transporter permease [Chloracidobacterium sp.]|nr:ABC transporter permease [Chloracidobacterium sp.]